MKIITKNNNYSNCYLIEFENSSYVIDPSVPYYELDEAFRNKLKCVLITHFHYDHVVYLDTYIHKNLCFYMHRNATNKFNDSYKNASLFFDVNFKIDLKDERIELLNGSEIIDDKIEVKYLPGHTDCSIGFVIDNNIFIGDVLFKNSIGRYDLYSSNPSDMLNTIELIKNMDNYNVYPGHGPITTINEEKKNNYYLNR